MLSLHGRICIGIPKKYYTIVNARTPSRNYLDAPYLVWINYDSKIIKKKKIPPLIILQILRPLIFKLRTCDSEGHFFSIYWSVGPSVCPSIYASAFLGCFCPEWDHILGVFLLSTRISSDSMKLVFSVNTYLWISTVPTRKWAKWVRWLMNEASEASVRSEWVSEGTNIARDR